MARAGAEPDAGPTRSGRRSVRTVLTAVAIAAALLLVPACGSDSSAEPTPTARPGSEGATSSTRPETATRPFDGPPSGRSPDGGGGSLPFNFWGGFHSPYLTSTVGLGWDWALYDRIHHRGSFGIFAPFATAQLGLDFVSVRILADAKAQYRWNWGDDDRWQITLGLSIGVYALD